MAANLGWFDARALARQGKAIRRSAWNYWLVRGLAVWHKVSYDTDGNPVKHPVRAADFGANEFLATDWTDAAFDSGALPTGVVTTPANPGAGNFGSDGNPPGDGSLFHLAGAASDENPRPAYTHTPPVGQTPVVNAVILPFDTTNAQVDVQVRLSIIGGQPRVGNYSLQLDANDDFPALTGLAWPGFEEILTISGYVIQPGSSFR